MRLALLATIASAAALTACATPHFYQREALALDDATLARFEVSYSDRSDCLLRQRWAERYDADRGAYQLALRPVLHFAEEPGEFRLELRGDGAPTAQARGAMIVEDAPASPGVRRYRVLPEQHEGAFTLTVWRGDERIGAEPISFRAQQCRALLWRD